MADTHYAAPPTAGIMAERREGGPFWTGSVSCGSLALWGNRERRTDAAGTVSTSLGVLVPSLPRPLPQGTRAPRRDRNRARRIKVPSIRPYGLPILQTAPARTWSVAGLVTTWLSYDAWPVGGYTGVE